MTSKDLIEHNKNSLVQLPTDPEELLNCIKSKYWRMNHLYVIKDKDNKRMVLKFNHAQEKVFTHHKHNKKIILKSRQTGVSTGFLAYEVDDCIFQPGIETGIQSYGKNESKKLAKRAKLMWEEFPELLKTILNLSLIKANSDELLFSNDASLKIGNFRGDTLQMLHVSELGKIAKKYPEKAEELKSGAFQAVSKNSKITIESTAEGKYGLLAEMWEDATLTLRIQKGKLTVLDFQPIFISWVEDPDCTLDDEVAIPPELESYFEKVEERLHTLEVYGCTVTRLEMPQKWWYVKKNKELKNKMKQEYPTFPEEAFEQSIEGTYYKDEYEQLQIVDASEIDMFNPNRYVNIAKDIGVNDLNVMLFFQWNDPYLDIIYEYDNNGKKMEYYAQIMRDLRKLKGYHYERTYFPHDVAVREYIAGSRLAAAKKLGFKPYAVPKLGIQDGIDLVRNLLNNSSEENKMIVRISSECVKLLASIQMYRKKKDDKLDIYLNQPVHDEHSHYADALRILAVGVKKRPPSNRNPSLRTESNLLSVDGFAI